VYSLVIPVFRNEGSLPELLGVLAELDEGLGHGLEAVLVVDGSPDRSAEILEAELPRQRFRSKLVLLSRNFGAFAAVRAGLAEASGPWFAVMAADLQEPPELVLDFFRALEKEPVDVVIGTRTTRDDPLLSRWSSQLFWLLYRKLVQPEMPPGGVDVFGCNQAFRDHLLALRESNSTLVGLLFWLGFRRKLFPYERRARRHGKSAWSLARRLRYLSDSVFAFSDLPVRLLVAVGSLGLLFSVAFALLVLVARLSGWIPVPGYAGTALLITFFAALNSFGLGVIGSYLWRAFENTKGRPESVVRWRAEFDGERRG
jgi:glycosyltransferase involved in cell wall biosynthesis